jgi:hypothetical protein
VISALAIDNEEFGSVSGMSPPIRVVRFGTDFEPNAISQGEAPIESRPILCVYHLIAGSDR